MSKIIPQRELRNQNAAVAHATGLALYTRNPEDFTGLDDLVTVVAI